MVNASFTAVVAVIITLVWVVAIWRLRWRRHRPHDRDIWTYRIGWIGLLTLALTITLSLPPAATAIDRLAGADGLADYLEHAAALLTSWIWLAYLHRLNAPVGRGRLLSLRSMATLTATALVFMAARFAVAPGQVDYHLGPNPDGAAYYMALYRFVYRGVHAIYLVNGIALLGRYVTLVVQRPSLRLRLRLLVGALQLTLLYVLYECLTIVTPLPSLHSRLGALRAMLVLVILIIPSSWYVRWLRLVRQGSVWFAWYRAAHRLQPLWRALYQVDPTLSLLPPPSRFGAWLTWRDLSFRVCRQVTEIRDWSRELRPYQDTEAAHVAEELGRRASLPAAELPQLAEAATLAVALHKWSRGRVPAKRALAWADNLTGPEPESEVATLARVADHFARSRIVRTILGQLDDRASEERPRTPQLTD